MTEFTRRPMRDDERGFVAKSWVESHSTSASARIISLQGTLGDPGRAWKPSREYWATWNALVDRLLDRCRTTVLEDDAGLVAAFVCWQPWETGVAVHYIYVRLMYRKTGLAKALATFAEAGPVVYTHRSRGITKIPEGWQYSVRPLFELLREKEAA